MHILFYKTTIPHNVLGLIQTELLKKGWSVNCTHIKKKASLFSIEYEHIIITTPSHKAKNFVRIFGKSPIIAINHTTTKKIS